MRQLTEVAIHLSFGKFSKLPMRQLTRSDNIGLIRLFSKLPMRQLT